MSRIAPSGAPTCDADTMGAMTKVWGHRGASEHAPENTIPAIELALAQGADGVEIDVQLTRDDEVVVIHDETLERTTDGHGWVADHSYDDLRRLDASAGHVGFVGVRIPTLAEVLATTGDALVNIELKNSEMPYKGLEERVLEVVAEHGASDRVVLSSFNHYSLRHFQELGASMPLGVLYSDVLFRPWSYATKLGAQAVHPPLRSTRLRLVEECHAHGLAVNVWTVNAPDDIRRMAHFGVDAIITNDPLLATSILG